MSSLASDAGLIIAAFDLFAVTSVIGASTAADLESGDVKSASGIVEKPEPAPQPDPNPSQNIDRFEPQSRDAAEQGRPHTIYLKPVTVVPFAHHILPLGSHDQVCPYCDEVSTTTTTTNPIEAPWKVLPWMDRAPRRTIVIHKIKLLACGSDMSRQGLMIDVVA